MLIIQCMVDIDLNLFHKISREKFTHTETCISSKNQEFTNELHKPITKKIKKHKVYSYFKD